MIKDVKCKKEPAEWFSFPYHSVSSPDCLYLILPFDAVPLFLISLNGTEYRHLRFRSQREVLMRS